MQTGISTIESLRTKHNFNSGPSVLPKEVFEEASQAVINFNDSGLSILELGHRTPLFQDVMDEARSLAKELMELDNDHEVLFLHGGASTQFMQVPMTDFVAVYVPMAYSVAGNVYIIPKERIKPITNISATQTMKFAVSGGVTDVEDF